MGLSEYPGHGEERRSSFRGRGEPLFALAIVLLVIGAALLVYGLIPQQQAQYTFLSQMQVPLYDSHGNYVSSPESYFRANYQGVGSVDQVQCALQSGGWLCYGYQYAGTRPVTSTAAQMYGAGVLALGAFSVFYARRVGPPAPKVSLGRRFTIRVDEDICVANGVCIELAPTVFKFKEQKTPTIFAPMAYVIDPEGADNATILQAAQMCPTGAIVIEDADTGERIHPPFPSG
jgi:ferredoxin